MTVMVLPTDNGDGSNGRAAPALFGPASICSGLPSVPSSVVPPTPVVTSHPTVTAHPSLPRPASALQAPVPICGRVDVLVGVARSAITTIGSRSASRHIPVPLLRAPATVCSFLPSTPRDAVTPRDDTSPTPVESDAAEEAVATSRVVPVAQAGISPSTFTLPPPLLPLCGAGLAVVDRDFVLVAQPRFCKKCVRSTNLPGYFKSTFGECFHESARCSGRAPVWFPFPVTGSDGGIIADGGLNLSEKRCCLRPSRLNSTAQCSI